MVGDAASTVRTLFTTGIPSHALGAQLSTSTDRIGQYRYTLSGRRITGRGAIADNILVTSGKKGWFTGLISRK